jgi:hypothetical protein
MADSEVSSQLRNAPKLRFLDKPLDADSTTDIIYINKGIEHRTDTLNPD